MKKDRAAGRAARADTTQAAGGRGAARRGGEAPRLFILAALALAIVAPAFGQAARSLAPVEHLRTACFDIYFPRPLAEYGKRLAGFADAALEDLEGLFGVEPTPEPGRGFRPATDGRAAEKDPAAGSGAGRSARGRIPVLLSDAEPDLNGYFTPYRSSRIVIYVASAGTSGQLASLDDELRQVFIHELTHAVTLTMRSPFWSFAAALAGDFVAPAAWVVPYSFVEGTAVWVESRGSAPGNALPASGRLNDPGALEQVFLDVSKGARRGLWDVSGVADYPGSGNLPYLYGALFAKYLEETCGEGSVEKLWAMAAEGNPFEGFDGTAATEGSLEKLSGRPPAALWNDFQDWLGCQAEPAAVEGQPIAAAAGGRIGPFCADANRLFYLDLERRAVLEFDLHGAPGAAEAANATNTPGAAGDADALGAQGAHLLQAGGKPRLLFPADGYVDDMWISPDGASLLLDWIRLGGRGEIIPARYSYNFSEKTLKCLGDRETEAMGAARLDLARGAPEPFLHGARVDGKSGFRYGLVRMGTRTMPARITPEGRMELLDSPLLFVRSLALGEGEGGRAVIAMSAASAGSLSRIALLREEKDEWKLSLQKTAPSGGASWPCPAGTGAVVYRAELGEGRQELRAIRLDESAPESDFEVLAAEWKPLETVRAEFAPGGTPGGTPAETAPGKAAGTSSTSSTSSASSTSGSSGLSKPSESFEPSGHYAALAPSLFPRLMATSRYPYADTGSAGLVFEGEDLTERLSWKATAGWDFKASTPESSLSLGLAFDRNYLAAAFADSTAPGSAGSSSTRILNAALYYRGARYFLPVHRRFWASLLANAAGLQDDYVASKFFDSGFDYLSLGGSARLNYSTVHSRPFAPFDSAGVALQAGADYEALPGTALFAAGAASLCGSLSLAIPLPAMILSLYGAWSPSGNPRFAPARRYFSAGGADYLSAISIPYPAYGEYSSTTDGSPWYCFAEWKARLASFELGEVMAPVRIFFLPGWTLRRISLWGGLRAAAFDSAGSPVFPASAFARAEIDAALLAGLAAEGRVTVHLEAAWAFSPALAGGNALHVDFGLGVTL